MAEKKSRFLCRNKKTLPSAHFGLFLPSGPTVLAHFWLFFSSHWTAVDHEHGHCELENRNKTFWDQFLGRRIRLRGQTGNFWKKQFFSSIKKNCPNNKKKYYDLGRHQIFFIKIVTLETGDMAIKVFFGAFWTHSRQLTWPK
jgi:hypothetical protein